MKLVRISGIVLFTLLTSSVFSQDLKKIYFKLETGRYNKGVQNMVAHILTKRAITIYTFTIPCKCVKHGSLSFYNHNNPETGTVMEPVRVVDWKQVKNIRFIKFDDLIKLLEKNDVDFNHKYILYFVEPGLKNYIYHVYKSTYFGDNAVDVIYADSAGNILPYIK